MFPMTKEERNIIELELIHLYERKFISKDKMEGFINNIISRR